MKPQGVHPYSVPTRPSSGGGHHTLAPCCANNVIMLIWTSLQVSVILLLFLQFIKYPNALFPSNTLHPPTLLSRGQCKLCKNSTRSGNSWPVFLGKHRRANLLKITCLSSTQRMRSDDVLQSVTRTALSTVQSSEQLQCSGS